MLLQPSKCKRLGVVRRASYNGEDQSKFDDRMRR